MLKSLGKCITSSGSSTNERASLNLSYCYLKIILTILLLIIIMIIVITIIIINVLLTISL